MRNMRMFAKIVDAGGITAAVERYGIEKSLLSRSLKALEQRFDGTLCSRGPRGFFVTDYGRSVYAATAQLADAVDSALNRINGAHQSFQGEVRLGVADNTLTNPVAKISDAIEEFITVAPAVRLSLQIFPPARLLTELTERKLHLGIVAADRAQQKFHAHPAFVEHFSLYCCPREGEQPPHLDRLATRGYGIVLRQTEREGPGKMSTKVPAAFSAEVSGLEAAAMLINTGRFVGFLPDHYVSGTRTRRPFVPVPGAEKLRLVTQFAVITERNRTISQAVMMLRTLLIKYNRDASKD